MEEKKWSIRKMARDKKRNVYKSSKEVCTIEPNDRDKWTIRILIALIIFFTLLALCIYDVRANDSSFHKELKTINTYVDYFYRNLHHKHKDRAKGHVPLVVRQSIDKKVDPLLISVLISLESSWRIKQYRQFK